MMPRSAKLGSAKQIAGVEHRAGRNAGGADQAHRLVLVVAQRPFGQHRVDLGFVPGARLARRKARVVDQVCLPDDFEQPPPMLGVGRGW